MDDDGNFHSGHFTVADGDVCVILRTDGNHVLLFPDLDTCAVSAEYRATAIGLRALFNSGVLVSTSAEIGAELDVAGHG